jgi:hypothetical protein
MVRIPSVLLPTPKSVSHFLVPFTSFRDPPLAYREATLFTSTMDMYRAIAQKNEYSPRALALTADLIDLVPAHYTIWYVE